MRAHADTAGETVAVTLLASFDRLLLGAGGDVESRMAGGLTKLLQRHGVPPEGLSPSSRVSLGLALDFLRLCETILQDSAIGLHAAQVYRHGDHELYDYLNGSAATLGACLQSAVEHARLLMTSLELSLVVDGDQTELRQQFHHRSPRSRVISEYALATMVLGGQHFFGAQVSPSRLRLAHPTPSHAPQLSALVGAELEYEAPYDALVLPTAALQLPLATRDDVMHGMLRDVARERMVSIPARESLVLQVSNEIEANLAHGVTRRQIARRFNMSEATLRRRLAAEGGSFKAQLESARRSMSQRLLSETALGYDEVSERVGFAQPSAFHRAFRRWFGQTAREYRHSQGHSPLVRWM